MSSATYSSEQEFQREALKYLNQFGFFFKDHNSGIRGRATFTKGKPDIVGVAQGLFFGFECKSKDGKLSPDQAIFLSNIRAHGGYGEMVKSLDDIREVLIRANISRDGTLPRRGT